MGAPFLSMTVYLDVEVESGLPIRRNIDPVQLHVFFCLFVCFQKDFKILAVKINE